MAGPSSAAYSSVTTVTAGGPHDNGSTSSQDSFVTAASADSFKSAATHHSRRSSGWSAESPSHSAGASGHSLNLEGAINHPSLLQGSIHTGINSAYTEGDTPEDRDSAYADTDSGSAESNSQYDSRMSGHPASPLQTPAIAYRPPYVETETNTEDSRGTVKYKPLSPASPASPMTDYRHEPDSSVQRSRGTDSERGSASLFETDSETGKSPMSSSRSSTSSASSHHTVDSAPAYEPHRPAPPSVLHDHSTLPSDVDTELRNATNLHLPDSPEGSSESSAGEQIPHRPSALQLAHFGKGDETLGQYSAGVTRASGQNDNSVGSPESPLPDTPAATSAVYRFTNSSNTADTAPSATLDIDESFWAPIAPGTASSNDGTAGTSGSGGTDAWAVRDRTSVPGPSASGGTIPPHQLSSVLRKRRGRRPLTLNLTLGSPKHGYEQNSIGSDTPMSSSSASKGRWSRFTSAAHSFFSSRLHRSPVSTRPSFSNANSPFNDSSAHPPSSAKSSCSFCSTARSVADRASALSDYLSSAGTGLAGKFSAVSMSALDWAGRKESAVRDGVGHVKEHWAVWRGHRKPRDWEGGQE